MWGGIGVALLIATVGTTVAGARRHRMWVWPGFCLALVIGSFLTGLATIYAAGPASS
jgi:hypothetical protein